MSSGWTLSSFAATNGGTVFPSQILNPQELPITLCTVVVLPMLVICGGPKLVLYLISRCMNIDESTVVPMTNIQVGWLVDILDTVFVLYLTMKIIVWWLIFHVLQLLTFTTMVLTRPMLNIFKHFILCVLVITMTSYFQEDVWNLWYRTGSTPNGKCVDPTLKCRYEGIDWIACSLSAWNSKGYTAERGTKCTTDESADTIRFQVAELPINAARVERKEVVNMADGKFFEALKDASKNDLELTKALWIDRGVKVTTKSVKVMFLDDSISTQQQWYDNPRVTALIGTSDNFKTRVEYTVGGSAEYKKTTPREFFGDVEKITRENEDGHLLKNSIVLKGTRDVYHFDPNIASQQRRVVLVWPLPDYTPQISAEAYAAKFVEDLTETTTPEQIAINLTEHKKYCEEFFDIEDHSDTCTKIGDVFERVSIDAQQTEKDTFKQMMDKVFVNDSCPQANRNLMVLVVLCVVLILTCDASEKWNAYRMRQVFAPVPSLIILLVVFFMSEVLTSDSFERVQGTKVGVACFGDLVPQLVIALTYITMEVGFSSNSTLQMKWIACQIVGLFLFFICISVLEPGVDESWYHWMFITAVSTGCGVSIFIVASIPCISIQAWYHHKSESCGFMGSIICTVMWIIVFVGWGAWLNLSVNAQANNRGVFLLIVVARAVIYLLSKLWPEQQHSRPTLSTVTNRTTGTQAHYDHYLHLGAVSFMKSWLGTMKKTTTVVHAPVVAKVAPPPPTGNDATVLLGILMSVTLIAVLVAVFIFTNTQEVQNAVFAVVATSVSVLGIISTQLFHKFGWMATVQNHWSVCAAFFIFAMIGVIMTVVQTWLGNESPRQKEICGLGWATWRDDAQIFFLEFIFGIVVLVSTVIMLSAFAVQKISVWGALTTQRIFPCW